MYALVMWLSVLKPILAWWFHPSYLFSFWTHYLGFQFRKGSDGHGWVHYNTARIFYFTMHYATEICVSIRVSSIYIISLHCLPDFYSLKWYCRLSLPKIPISGGILRGSRRERLLSKFVENECEKIDRLMELYMRWVLICFFISVETYEKRKWQKHGSQYHFKASFSSQFMIYF